MDSIRVFGYEVRSDLLTQAERDYLIGLPDKLPSVEWVWKEMDRIWAEQKLDNKLRSGEQLIGNYYSHPVWLMNGVFTMSDPASVFFRRAISDFIKSGSFRSIADYGGGFGELALTICKAIPDATVSVIEPYPSRVGLERLRKVENILVVSNINAGNYDVVIAQDVLEHVEDPVGLAFKLASATNENGKVIFANCFYPVIQCHLPATFHLRHTFAWVIRALGLRYVGRIEGATYAQVFERRGQLDLAMARRAEAISQQIAPVLNSAREVLRRTVLAWKGRSL